MKIIQRWSLPALLLLLSASFSNGQNGNVLPTIENDVLRISLSISDASLTVVDKRITLEWRQQARPPLSCRSRQHPHKANLSFRESAWGRSNLRPHDLSYQGVPVRIRSSARYAGSALRRNSRLSL